ncbi:MAG: hypothetical protein HKP61_22375 [Dactylosporangium sp.]|nr:hypothetical protein [Dactylosporangium sp.]NNJ63623.1 hypothetical protein [Dactylosporangium sp.]
MWEGQPAECTTATLRGYGRVSWADLVAALTGATAAWADYDGFHIGDPPAAAPPYTHLWGWADGWMLRARLDGDHAIVATLHLDNTAPSGITSRTPGERLSVTRTRSRTWPSTEHRVGKLNGEVADRPVVLYQLDGDRPVTFVRVG